MYKMSAYLFLLSTKTLQKWSPFTWAPESMWTTPVEILKSSLLSLYTRDAIRQQFALISSRVSSWVHIVTTFSHNARGEIPQTVLLLCYKTSLFWTATLKAVFVIWKRVIFLLCPQLQVPLQRHTGAPKGHRPIFVCVSQFSGFFCVFLFFLLHGWGFCSLKTFQLYRQRSIFLCEKLLFSGEKDLNVS